MTGLSLLTLLKTSTNIYNNDWAQKTGKRIYSSFLELNSPTNTQNKVKELLFKSKNRYGTLLQTDKIDIDMTISNTIPKISNNSELHLRPEENTYLLPSIIVKCMVDLGSMYLVLIDLVVFSFKLIMNNLKTQMKNPEAYRKFIIFYKILRPNSIIIKCKKAKPTEKGETFIQILTHLI